jgi:glutamate--cysteine ligase
LLQACQPIAQALDAAHGGGLHAQALASARASLMQPDTLPSARVLNAVRQENGHSFVQFIREQSEKTRAHILALPFDPALQDHFEKLRAASVQEQNRIEAADRLPFEIYRQQYVSAYRLGQPAGSRAQPLAFDENAGKATKTETAPLSVSAASMAPVVL